jgi:hypothetical protein
MPTDDPTAGQRDGGAGAGRGTTDEAAAGRNGGGLGIL